VHVGITQVDLARFRLSEPARPVAPSAPGTPTQPGGGAQFGATVARDLVQALVDLLNVQNDFLSVWVDQEVQRLNLDFDLGIMELDENGIRIEHQMPLRAFVAAGACNAPYELPAPCAEVEQEVEQPPAGEQLPILEEQGPELLPEPLPPN
jgi:hypothetical protein